MLIIVYVSFACKDGRVTKVFLHHESAMRRLDDLRCGAPAAACGLVWKYKEAYWTGALFERGDVTARLDWGLQVAGALSGVLILGYGFRDGRVATLERDNNTTQSWYFASK